MLSSKPLTHKMAVFISDSPKKLLVASITADMWDPVFVLISDFALKVTLSNQFSAIGFSAMLGRVHLLLI